MKELSSQQAAASLQQTSVDNTGSEEPTIEQQVNSIVSKATKDDNGDAIRDNSGNFFISKEATAELDPAIAYAVSAEIRVRNTQSGYTRSQKELSKSTAINKKLVGKLTDNLTVQLSDEDKAKLEAVKSDPERYHLLRTELENTARTSLQEELTVIETESATLSELETRTLQLNAFNDSSEVKITQTVIDEQLPASYSKELADGKVTFTEFLTKAQQFLTKNKVIAGADEGDLDDNPVDLEKLSGGSTPNNTSTKKDTVSAYKDTIY